MAGEDSPYSAPPGDILIARMATKAELISQIHYGLSQLRITNSHHEFEKLCLHLARVRIASNLLPATGPVSAGGDQARDFETFKTYVVVKPTAPGSFDSLASSDTIAFACTTETAKSLKSKIQEDVETITSQGVPPQRIYVFASEDLTTSTRHKLQDWAHSTYGVALEILDGQALSLQLADADTFDIARTYLHLPKELVLDFHQPAATSLAAQIQARNLYSSRVAQETQTADYRGIAGAKQSEHLVALTLEEVYVPPSFSEWSGDAGEPRRESRGSDAQELTIANILSRNRRTVFLGPAGSGKSTLIRFLARLCALGEEALKDRLGWSEPLVPIMVCLAVFAEAHSRRPELPFGSFLNEILTEAGGDPLRSAIAEDLESGRVFLLLNGLDEVIDALDRAKVIQSIERFLLQYPANRVLVTSRLSGYTSLAGGFKHFQIARLNPQQIEECITRWYRASEVLQHPDAQNSDRAEQEALSTRAQIFRNPLITELASNPLMLTILIFLRQEHPALPDKRVEVYDRMIRTLVDTWGTWRSVVGVKRQKSIDSSRRQIISALAAMALWMRSDRSSGLIHRAELKRKILDLLSEQGDQAREIRAEDILNFLIADTGLLLEQGHDLFRFWHSTFEEFFAALALATPTTTAIEKVLPLRTDPRWRDVIPLCVAYIGTILQDSDSTTDLVEAIASREPRPLEPIFHSNLLLAADCVAEEKGVKAGLIASIIALLADILRSRPYSPFVEAFSRIVRSHPRLRPTPASVAPLASLVDDSSLLSDSALRLISNAAPFDPQAREICNTRRSRWLAALGLAQAGDSRREIWTTLLGARHSDTLSEETLRELLANAPETTLRSIRRVFQTEDARLRLAVAERLLDLGVCQEEAISALSRTLEDGDANQRYEAAKRLYDLGLEESRILQTMLTCASDASFYHREELADFLARKGLADEQKQVLLICISSGDLDESLPASMALLEMGFDRNRIVNEIALLLEPINGGMADHYYGLRVQAVEILRSLRPGDKRVIPTLYSCLDAFDDEIVFRAATKLIKFGAEDQHILTRLSECLTNHDEHSRHTLAPEDVSERLLQLLGDWLTSEDLALRSGAAELLVEIERVDERVIEALLSCVDPVLPGNYTPPPEWDPRFRALDLLFELGVNSRQVAPKIRAWLAVDDFTVQLQIAEYLSEQSREPGLVAESLSRRLAGSTSERLRAAQLLLRLKRADETVVSAVKHVLGDHNLSTRLAAAELLASIGEFGEEEVQAVEPCLSAPDKNLRFGAATLLVRLKRTEPSPVPALAEVLTTGDYYRIENVVDLLLQHGRVDTSAWEAVLQMLEPDRTPAAAVLRRVIEEASIGPEESAVVLTLVSIREGDERHRRAIRSALFRWLSSESRPKIESADQPLFGPLLR